MFIFSMYLLTLKDNSSKNVYDSYKKIKLLKPARFFYIIIIKFKKSLNMFSSRSILLLVMILMTLTVSNDWQAMGNFTNSNITFIYSTINDCINKKTASTLAVSGFPKAISDALNSVWDKAWNVFVTELTDYQTDSVVYGYAFREHWFWHNNYGTDHLGYVIWKDYNCGIWVTLDHSGYGTFNYTFPVETFNAVTNKINGIVDPKQNLYTDPWEFAFQLVNWMNGQYTGAYSAVVYTYNSTSFHGRFCNYNDSSYTFSFKSIGLKTLSYLLFRTR